MILTVLFNAKRGFGSIGLAFSGGHATLYIRLEDTGEPNRALWGHQMEGRSRVCERLFRAWCVGPVALAIAGGGCVSPAVLSQAERAEASGDYHQAYVIYCAAARANPNSGKVRSALDRVAPLAAQGWVGAARDFEQRGQYDLAWQCYIRSLLIRPSDSAALAGIQKLEREHADRVAASKNAWQRYGERSLQTVGVDWKRLAGAQRPAGDDEPESTAEAGPGRPDHAAAAATEDEPAAPRADARLPAAPAPAAADARPTAPAPGKPAVKTKPAAVETAAAAALEADTSAQGKDGFLTTAIVSREDERFSDVAMLLDGVRVRVLDTDPGPDADVSIYRGRRRVHKIRNWRVGESVGITGASGRAYEIRLISIFDATESIRVGIRSIPIQPAGESL
ncbi:MAG: hypothetical protein JSV19_02340 [Phycisphaerales bacterium]|nr:MAG: hypothetical protein JSV19_02340 [Phycisphaerales bacterium]